MGLRQRPKDIQYKLRLEAGFPTKETELELKDKLFNALNEILDDNPKDKQFVFVDSDFNDRFLGASLGFLGGVNGYRCLGLLNRDFNDNWKDKFDWYRFFKKEDFNNYVFIIYCGLINNKKEINVSWEYGTTKRVTKYHSIKETPCYYLFVDLPFEHENYFSISLLPDFFSEYCNKKLSIPKKAIKDI